jgi:outer membrane protein assembly factor BamA
LEDFDTTAVLGLHLTRWLETGVSVGKTIVNTGPGTDDDWPSIEERFTPAEVPALDHQADYSHWGAFLRADHRDEPDDPRRGGLYEFRWTSFHDRELGRFDFRRYGIDLRRFFSCFSDRDTVALRGLVTFSQKRPDQEIPFFLQPTAGGGGTVRGYGHYRFRDRNALVLNLEYRWRVQEMFHAVVFADAGRVFHRPGQFGLAGLRGSAGAGGRVKLGDRIFIGVDFGWSPEGPHLWCRGSHVF